MTETQDEGQRNLSFKRLVGKIALGVGLCLISFVIAFGMLVSLVSAYGGSTELFHVYDTIVLLGFVFGILFVIGGLMALILPEGLSKDGTWSLQTGPFR